MSYHTLEISKSGRAKCRSTACLVGGNIPKDTLRYGYEQMDHFHHTTTTAWMHWECVTPTILQNLASTGLERVRGFSALTPADQQKVRVAVARKRVGDPLPPLPVAGNKRNRVDFEASQASSCQQPHASSSQPRLGAASAGATVATDGDDGDEQEEADDPPDELYTTLETQVVGIQYYHGMVGAGEQVRLVREPHNRYDRNAIQVKNISNIQVGHIPRGVASQLAPLLDQNLVTVEGVMKNGNLQGAGYNLQVSVKIFGSSVPSQRAALEPHLVWATPGRRGFGPEAVIPPPQPAPRSKGRASQAVPLPPSSAPGPSQLSAAQRETLRRQQEDRQRAEDLRATLATLQTMKVDDEQRRNGLLDQLVSVNDVLQLPLCPNAPGIGNGLVVNLLKHQSQGLQWALEHENPVLPSSESDKPVQFWQRKTGHYLNVATNTPQKEAPVLGRGALIADAMGLGKTLTLLALILKTKQDIPQGFSNSTLIVCPLSVLSNWEKQIKDHCEPGALTYYKYYGPERDISAAKLQEYDVVITTYQVIAGEHDVGGTAPTKKKQKMQKTLFEIKWKRVALDEAHTIRNPKTKAAKASFNLVAQRRWALAATPIINSPSDLGSILRFLQICKPLDDEDFFKRLILRPVKDADSAGLSLLTALMTHICLRRTKEMQDADGNPLVPLPPVEMIKIPVQLTPEARTRYDEIEAVSRQRITEQLRGGDTMSQSHILSILTRMRQMVLHTALVPARYIDELRANEAEVNPDARRPQKALTPEDKAKLQSQLAKAIEDSEECAICFDQFTEPRITTCGHIFCFGCISIAIQKAANCPMDRRALSLDDLHILQAAPDATQAPFKDEELEQGGSSAKIDQLVQLLRLSPARDKSLVFSQFTTFLDKIGERLEEEGIDYVRFDGRMSAKRREDTIAQFSIPVTADEGANMEVDEYDDADDAAFIDHGDDDEDAYTSRKGKGKAKAQAKTKGKGKQKATATAYASTVNGSNPKVMLISLKAGALGLNLTVANNVYLMDPWWQEGIESQAIDRVNRIGQTKNVRVYQLIAENTVESKVLEIQDRRVFMLQITLL